MNCKIFYFAVALYSLVPAGSAWAEGFILLRQRGDIAPQTEGNSFLDFSESVLNDGLGFAYRGRLELGAGVNLRNNTGAWADDGCAAKLLARKRDPAPGTSIQFAEAIDQSSFQLNDASVMAFRANLQGSRVDNSNDVAIFMCLPGGSTTLVAHEGDVDAITGGTFAILGRPALTASASGDLFFAAHLVQDGVTATAPNDRAIYGYLGGALSLIVREGDPTPPLNIGGVGTYGEILSEAYVSDSGYLVFLANIVGVGQANIGVFQRDPGGTISLLYQKSEPAPDETGAATAELLSTFRQVGVNDSGEVIIRANLLIGTAGVTPITDEIILTNSGGTFRRLAREGSPDPGGDPYFNFQTVFIGNSGATVYAAQTRDGGGVLRKGIYATSIPIGGGAVSIIAREGDPAPGTPSTHLRLDRPVVSHEGRVAYTSRLAQTGGITQIDDSTLWFTESAATPASAPIAQEGDFENDAQGIMLAFDLNEPNEPNGGVASSGRAVNDTDNLIVNITTRGEEGTREGVYILGDRPPVFCDGPPDIAFNIPVGSGPVPVSWTPPTVIDDLDPTPTVVASHVPGALFDVGVTIVSYTATDSAGNMSIYRFRIIITEIRDPGELVALDRIVTQGDPATKGGEVYQSFTEVVVNANADVAFTGSATGGLRGTWSNSHGAPGGTPGLVVLQGDTADGSIEYKSFERLAFNDFGDLLFQSVLQGAGLTANTNQSVDIEFGMALGTIVREGNAAPDALGAATPRVFRQFYGPAITPTATAESYIRGNLLLGAGGVTSTGDTGIWQLALGGTMVLQRVVEGDPLPDGLTIGQVSARVVAGGPGLYVFSSGLKGPGVRHTNDGAVFIGDGTGGIVQLVREGDRSPCGVAAISRPVKNTRTNDGRFSTFFAEAINDTGTTVAIRAAMAREGRIDFDNDTGIWAIDVATREVTPVVIEGHQAPGYDQGVQYDRFDDVVVTPSGDIWFTAYLRHDADLGISSANDFGIWTSSDGFLRWMAHEGQTAPNTDGGIVRRISNFAYEGRAVSATIVLDIGTGDATGRNETCLLAGFDALTGLFEISLREGDMFNFAKGDPRTITFFKLRTMFNASGGSGGYGQPVTGGGVDLVAIPLTFSGNSGAIVLREVSDVGPVP